MTTAGAVARGEYLKQFAKLAALSSLPAGKSNLNWTALPDLAYGSHISTSVTQHQVQVNLNLTGDDERVVLGELLAIQNDLERWLGTDLLFDNKPNTKKSAVRASLGFGYLDRETWSGQHYWAVGLMLLFQDVFRPRVQPERTNPAFGIF